MFPEGNWRFLSVFLEFQLDTTVEFGAPQTPGNGDLSLLKNRIFLNNHSVK